MKTWWNVLQSEATMNNDVGIYQKIIKKKDVVRLQIH